MAIEGDVVLIGFAGGLGNGLALGDEDLGAHDVDAGDLFGDGMFDLHARVYFDEVKLAGVHIHKEFDRAGAFVIHVFADLVSEFANLGALKLGEVGGGGAFDHLLIAALDRAIALKKVIHAAVLVTQYLHLDMAGTGDHLFEIPFAIAKGGFGFAAPFEHLFFQLTFRLDRAHAAPAAAPGGLEHEGIADFRGLFARVGHVIAQDFGGGDDGDTGLDCHAPRAGLVAERAHGAGPGADEAIPAASQASTKSGFR